MSEKNLKIEINRIGRDEWNRFVNNTEDSHLYHLYQWGDIIEKSLNHKKLYLSAHRNDEIVGLLPLFLFESKLFGKRIISMPFLNYGGVCGSDPDVEKELYHKAAELAGGYKVSDLELRNCRKSGGEHPTKDEKATYVLNLKESEEETFKGIRKATRNRIRKSGGTGLTMEKGAHLLDDFYNGFAQAMKEHGTPVLTKSFFRELVLNFDDTLSFYIAKSGEDITGVKCMIDFKGVQYQIWGGYPNRFKKLLSNYYLTWEAVKDAHEKSLYAVDLGRSTKGSGPADFKRYFGCEEYQLYWEYPYLEAETLPDVNPQNPKYKAAISVWRKLPLPLTKLIGPPLARQLP